MDHNLIIYISVDGDIRCEYSLTKLELHENLPLPDELTLNAVGAVHQNNPSIDGPCNIVTNVLLIKPFVDELKSSQCYRNGVYNKFRKQLKFHCKLMQNKINPIVIHVSMKDSYIIDYAWGWRLWRICHMGLERDCAVAWLSTLGGAFSALGDYFERCAKMALRISMQQIKLSVMAGDKDGVARGWLFLALALSQLGYGNAAFHLLHLAYNTPSYDDRHKCMCLGVQAKLKYDRKLRIQSRKEGTLRNTKPLVQVLRTITL